MPDTQPDFQDIREAVIARACVNVEAANACLQFHGGFGFATEYGIERRFREARREQVAPTSTNPILPNVAAPVPGMPRSF